MPESPQEESKPLDAREADALVHRLETTYLARVVLSEQMARGGHFDQALAPAYNATMDQYWAISDELRARLVSSTLSETRGAQ